MNKVCGLMMLLAGLVAAVLIAGVIKFNVMADDVLLARSAVRNADLVGGWVEPVPGQAGQVQGMALQADGMARSINMATLSYMRWTVVNGKLTLAGESCGNHICGEFVEGFQIHALGQGRLRLIDEAGQVREFLRNKVK